MKRKLFFLLCALLTSVGMWAQTDVTSTYLTNANFEGSKTVQQSLNGGDRAIYKPDGWTVSYSNGAQYDMTAMKEGDLSWNTFTNDPACALPVNGGEQVYFMRFRWSGPTIKISQTTSSALPAGTYRVSADAYRNGGNGTATLSAGGKSVTVDTRNRWANYAVVFTLTEAASVEVSLTFTGSADKAVAGVDNFKLENITQGASDLSHDWTTTIANAGFELGSPEHTANSFTAPYGYTMAQVAAGWKDGAINTTNPSEGSKLYNYYSDDITSLDFYQGVSLPAGKYTISADLRTEFSSQITDQGVYAKIGEDIFKSGTIQTIGSPWNGAEAWNNLSKDFYVQSDGTVQLGASSTGSGKNGWFQIDNFQLTYKGAVQNTPYSIALGSATAANAGSWYKINIPIAGDYRIISSVDNTVYYTQNGYYAPSDASSASLSADVKQVLALTQGDLYVSATEDATLTIEPDVYAYSVGDGTPSVADNGYTQSNTMTITFADAITNDPDGALSILDASKIKVNDVAATASIDGKVLTITLASTLATSTGYAVSVEAGAVGYNVDNTNTAISLTAKTPDVFDGIYYIKQNDADKYVSRGGDDNTEAILDSYGIPVQLTTNGENVTRVKFLDTNQYLGGGSSQFWTDKAESFADGGFTVAKSGDNYTFYLASKTKYMKAGTSVAEYADDAYAWTLEATSAHAAKLQAVKDAQAAAVATTAGISASTQAALATNLAANYGETPIGITGVSGVSEQYQKSAAKGTGTVKKFFSETKEGLKAGLYRVRVNAFERIAGLNTVLEAGGAAGLAYVYANGEKVQLHTIAGVTKATPWSDATPADVSKPEGYYVNNTTSADVAFDKGYYVNDVYIYLAADGNIEFGIATTNCYGNNSEDEVKNSQWICYNNFSLVKFDDKPTAGEKTALANAITAAEANTLGFENGEYAPYSNVDAIEKLNAAKAIDPDVASGVAVVAATTALTGATWTANVGKKDAICNGSFTGIERGTQDNVVPGWTGVFRKLVTTDDYAALSASKEGRAMFSHAKTYVYGDQAGYTIPLKSKTKYTVSFKAAGWENGNLPTVSAVVKKPNGDNMKTLSISPTKRISETESLVSGSADFVVETAGNYTMEVTVVDNTLAVITDFSIVSSGVVTTLGTNGYATFASPYALDLANLPSGLTAYKAAVSETTVTFTEVTEAVQANTGLLLKGDASESYDIPYAASGSDISGTNAFLVNEGGTTFAGDANYNYFGLKANTLTFGLFDPASVAIPSNKAYLKVAKSSGARLTIVFEDDDPMAINAIEAADVKAEGLKDGKYLMKGKIVLVKNGVKFNANGQILK